MIDLSLERVRAAGREAYLTRKLSAFGPTPACRYRDKSGLPCIIGAAMTPAEAQLADSFSDTAVTEIVEGIKLRDYDGDETDEFEYEPIATTDNLEAIELLQRLHDEMTRQGGNICFYRLSNRPYVESYEPAGLLALLLGMTPALGATREKMKPTEGDDE